MNKSYMPTKAKSIEHETPDWLFKELDAEFGFSLDAAASHENHKCNKYYTKEDDALTKSWLGETVWINPPFDVKSLTNFVKKAFIEQTFVIMLVPVKSDQDWWKYALKSYEIRYIKGRIRFKEEKSGHPQPLCILVFNIFGVEQKNPHSSILFQPHHKK